jgi:NAD dependent epimerase/dehydratase family enzyme
VLFGEMANVLLIRGQRVVPKRAHELGFHFLHPTIDDAMRAVAGGAKPAGV